MMENLIWLGIKVARDLIHTTQAIQYLTDSHSAAHSASKQPVCVCTQPASATLREHKRTN